MVVANSAGSLMRENVIHVFVDNPLTGVVNIMLILVLFLGIIALLGLIFKKQDECIGSGILRLLQIIGVIIFAPLGAGICVVYYYYSIPIVLVILAIACYLGYKEWKGIDAAADNDHSAQDEEKKQDEKINEETEGNAAAVPALSKN